MKLRNIRLAIRRARLIYDAADRGAVLIEVPSWMAAEVSAMVWERKRQRSAEKWAERAQDIPLSEWQSAMTRKHPGSGGKSPG